MAITNAVVDISHHNNNVNFKRAKEEGGILGVIHKASQGQSNVDPTYRTRRTRAAKEDLLWGAYHFGTGSDGLKQAQNFLKVVGDDPGTLLVLDFEPNPTGPSMSLEEARAFVTHVQAVTGRFPGLYSGHFIKDLLGTRTDPVLSNCWFWLAQYGPTAVVPPNWPTWTLWQYTDGRIGGDPKVVDGIGPCDRSRFNGPEATLRKLWRVE